jgi:hypothetical protein
MTTSVEGVLVYGYELGGNDQEWRLKGFGEDNYEELERPWLKDDFCGDAEDFLLEQIAGFRRDDFTTPPYEEYRAAKAAAEREVGVFFDTHGHHAYSAYLIYTKRYSIHQSQGLPISITELNGYPYAEWDAKLARALELLDLDPQQVKPFWILTAEEG